MAQSMQGLLNVEPESKHTIKLSILWAGILSALSIWNLIHWDLTKKESGICSCTKMIAQHSMARVNLNKSKKVLTSTATASKYLPKRPRICINWNPRFQTSLHKNFKNCFLSKSCFTMFTFRSAFTK